MRRQAISSIDRTAETGRQLFDGFDDAVVVVDVDLVAGLDQDDVGAEALGFADLGAGS